MLWHGSLETIPSGWHVCDGNEGTPNLIDRYVRGASEGIPPGEGGGAYSHAHDFTGDGHGHELVFGADFGGGSGLNKDTTSVPAVGTTETAKNHPPFLTLYYIMKL